MPKTKPKTPFEVAYAARKGDVPPEMLRGAAKRLFNDKTLTEEQLKEYTTPRQSGRTRSFAQNHRR